MSLTLFVPLLIAASVVAGMLGAVLGLGGGIIIPLLTLVFGFDIRFAIGASIVSVIATSSAAAVAYVRDQITNVRIGMVLEMATTVGAVVGALVAGIVRARYLGIIFGVVLILSALELLRKHGHQKAAPSPQGAVDPFTARFRLDAQYDDPVLQQKVAYRPRRLAWAFPGMAVAGLLSGLLGIGSGTFKVLVMDIIMELPPKVSSATSNLMIGVTAAASAAVYFMRGDIVPLLAGPVALGIFIGALLGARAMPRLRDRTLIAIFIPVIIAVALEMIYQSWNH